MYEVILQGYGWNDGWKLLAKIARNVRSLSGTASQVGKDVGTGEVVVGIAIDTYAGELIRQFGVERIEFIAPSDYTSVNGDGIAVIAGAPHANLAKEFIEFTLSEAGQKLWYLKAGVPGGPRRFEIGKLPILPSVYGSGPSNSVLKGAPDSWKNVLAYDSTTAGNRWNLVNDLFGVFVIDVHDRLVRVAQTSPQTPPPPMPVTETEARTLSPDGHWGSDATIRNIKLREWADVATRQLPREATAFDAVRWLPSAILLGLLTSLMVRRVASRGRR
jgi:ABC-type glycerol-3-phosphate transport system substrate-binding protein